MVYPFFRHVLCISVPLLFATHASAEVTNPDDLADVAANVPGAIEHCDEQIAARDFNEIFDCGDELFETQFNAVDGVGASFGTGQRFTRTPRFDLDGYADIVPPRQTGPNAQSCADCHLGAEIGGAGDGSGPVNSNNVQDLVGLRGVADPKNFVTRNPPHLFAPGAIQVGAEEITRDLFAIRDTAVASACSDMQVVTAPLTSKGISFGSISVSPMGCPDAQIDASGVIGVDADLVVKPFGWKGTVAALRLFNAAAFHNELGMTPTEFAGPGVDSDADGVTDEIFVEDVSAMTVYLAAQPRPTTLVELDDLRRFLLSRAGFAGLLTVGSLGLPELLPEDRQQIGRGEATFAQIGCADCHMPQVQLDGVIFAEPSPLEGFRFDFGVDPRVAEQVDPANPLTFDLTRDQPDNVISVRGRIVTRLGSLEAGSDGGAIARAFTDFKRHEMGAALADSIATPEPLNPAVQVSETVFLTEALWGVGSTSPYLHDGRATTIEEAIIEHGGEAADSRDQFRALSTEGQADVLAFLDNLVLFFPSSE